MNRKILFACTAVLLVLVFVIGAVLFQKNKAAEQRSSVSRNQDVTQREGAPVKGPEDARVTIVEFLDPACGTCREFYPLVKQLIDQYPGKVRVMVRYAPLHPGSEKVVQMLEAARHQGKFWQALELLFSNQGRWVINHKSQPMRARTILNALDVDQKKLTADMNHPEVAQVIQQDVQDGQLLNVRATPEFFVNGRPMLKFGYPQLSILVKEAVAEAY
jgi:protein-disulfide isomerase